MFRNISKLSIRAATWVGSKCLRKYCNVNNINDRRIFDLCDYLEELATESDIPAWDGRGSELTITGLGDPMPKVIENNKDLVKIIECTREISASQIYGAWVPKYTKEFLGTAMKLSNFKLSKQSFRALSLHDPKSHGWGEPVNEHTLNEWAKIV